MLAGNQLLSQEYVKFDRHGTTSDRDGRKAIYGGAGFDISNYLLSINAPEAYFVGDYSDLSLEDFQDVKEALENATKHRDIMEGLDSRYLDFKFANGFASEFGLTTKEHKKAALLLELESMGILGIEIDTNSDFPRINFDWKQNGTNASHYAITFVSGDIRYPSRYSENFRRIVESGFDQRITRGNAIARYYLEFIPYFFQHMDDNGVFVTDDYFAAYIDPNVNRQIFHEASFPPEIEKNITREVREGSGIQNFLVVKEIFGRSTFSLRLACEDQNENKSNLSLLSPAHRCKRTIRLNTKFQKN